MSAASVDSLARLSIKKRWGLTCVCRLEAFKVVWRLQRQLHDLDLEA
jgi:hypothetical protein